MTLHRSVEPEDITRVALTLFALFTIIGFYIGCAVVTVIVGEDAFNAAAPNPWRLLICLPAFIAIPLAGWGLKR